MLLHYAYVWILRIVACLLIYVAEFLYEDEELKIQNRLEGWWIRLNDKQHSALSLSTRFMQGIAQLVTRGFDRLFGKPLFSLRALVASFCYSFVSLYISVEFLIILRIGKPAHVPSLSVGTLWVVFFAVGGTYPLFLKDQVIYRIRNFSISLYLILDLGLLVAFTKDVIQVVVLTGARVGLSAAVHLIEFMVLTVASSFVSDFLYIAITRWMLRKMPKIEKSYKIVFGIMINILIMVGLITVPAYLGLMTLLKFHSFMVGVALIFCLFLNSIDVLVCLTFIVLALALLVHRLVWPVLERPLYAFARLDVVGRKKLLYVAAVVLFALSCWPQVATWLRFLAG